MDFFPYVPYCIQHCFICRPSDSTVSEDAGIDPRTVATLASAVRRSNHSARSHPLRVAIFRKKNFSAEHGTDGNFDSFRRNSASFAERKKLGIPFQAILRKIKSSEFRFAEEKNHRVYRVPEFLAGLLNCKDGVGGA